MTITSVCGCRSLTLRSTSSPSPPRPMRRSVMTTSNSPVPSARSAESGSARLGGEERIEDAREVLGLDSLSRVFHFEEGLSGLPAQPHGDAASSFDRVASVAEQVPEHGLDLTRVDGEPHRRKRVDG